MTDNRDIIIRLGVDGDFATVFGMLVDTALAPTPSARRQVDRVIRQAITRIRIRAALRPMLASLGPYRWSSQ